MAKATVEAIVEATIQTERTVGRGDTIRKTEHVDELSLSRDIQVPNPNLDAYLSGSSDYLWLYDDYRRPVKFGEGSELSVERVIDVNVHVSEQDLLMSAELRASEDMSDVETVLENWSSMKHFPSDSSLV